VHIKFSRNRDYYWYISHSLLGGGLLGNLLGSSLGGGLLGDLLGGSLGGSLLGSLLGGSLGGSFLSGGSCIND
jgi:hypothetical protein